MDICKKQKCNTYRMKWYGETEKQAEESLKIIGDEKTSELERTQSVMMQYTNNGDDEEDSSAKSEAQAKTDKMKRANERTLPSFTKGESGEHQPTLTEKWTTPPKYYTEATLLRAMETAGKFVEDEELRAALKENGIGRPSSRAGIIETLFKRHYIRRQRKNLMATPTGIELIDTIHEELLKSCELTGIWDVDVFKYTMNGQTETALAGATFTLSNNSDGTNPIDLISEGNNVYRVAKTGETGTVTEITTDTTGTFTIQGLDADTYYLTETAEKGRLQPGKILLIDTQEGKIYYDGEIKERLAEQHPYRPCSFGH